MSAGIATPVLPKRGLALSIGARMEGVPVHDLFGSSNGFRRPGYAISVEPGLLFGFQGCTFSMFTPVAIWRNRLQSVPDLKDGVWGDAAFADNFWIFGLSKKW
jgi:hypothetical protein